MFLGHFCSVYLHTRFIYICFLPFFDRLWHQLTLKLTDFVQDPCFSKGDGLIQVSDQNSAAFAHFRNVMWNLSWVSFAFHSSMKTSLVILNTGKKHFWRDFPHCDALVASGKLIWWKIYLFSWQNQPIVLSRNHPSCCKTNARYILMFPISGVQWFPSQSL